MCCGRRSVARRPRPVIHKGKKRPLKKVRGIK